MCDKFVYSDQLTKDDVAEFLTQELIKSGELMPDQKIYCTRLTNRYDKHTGKRTYTHAVIEIPHRVGNKTVYKSNLYRINDYSISNNTNFNWIKFMYRKFGEKYKEDMEKLIFGQAAQ